ncbi:MAG TPA: hypothetical protein VJS45_02010 [Acidimicrobiia bacterium]|nr:hypothetical protein [Acidimicrobiia bacterium]
MRLIGYLRMRAVGGVVEGAGFGEQDRRIRAWAEQHGHVVVRTVVDRYSGDTAPSGLAGAVQAVWADEADAVVVASRSGLDASDSVGVKVLAADEPDPVLRPQSAERRGRARANAGWAVAQWVAIALAALVAHGVANAADRGDLPSGMEGRCDPAQIGMPCDGTEWTRELDVAPPTGCHVYDAEPSGRLGGIWLCLRGG